MEQMKNENGESKMGSGSWSDTKAKIKMKWNKLSDKDVEDFKKGLGQIPARLQSVYGYSKDVADREFKEFQQSLGTKGASIQSQPETSTTSRPNASQPSNPMPGLDTKIREDKGARSDSSQDQSA